VSGLEKPREIGLLESSTGFVHSLTGLRQATKKIAGLTENNNGRADSDL